MSAEIPIIYIYLESYYFICLSYTIVYALVHSYTISTYNNFCTAQSLANAVHSLL
jgi:hypothetical protein